MNINFRILMVESTAWKQKAWSQSCHLQSQWSLDQIRVEDHLGLVRLLAGKFLKSDREWSFCEFEPPVALEDTEEYSDGLVGLFQATRCYHAIHNGKSVRFSTYAYYCIKNEIIKGRKQRNQEVKNQKLEIEQREKWAEQATKRKREKRRDIDDVAKYYERRTNRYQQPDCSELDEARRVAQFVLEKYPEDTPTNRLNKQVIIDYFLKEETLTDIGQKLGGVTKERIRQRREEGLKQIRELLSA
jgi:RNA polymerase sigma factor (sigma-70 family)